MGAALPTSMFNRGPQYQPSQPQRVGCSFSVFSAEGGDCPWAFYQGAFTTAVYAGIFLIAVCAAKNIARRSAEQRRKRAAIGESHLFAAEDERNTLRAQLKDMREKHPELGELAAAEHAATENEADEIERRVSEAFISSRTLSAEETRAVNVADAENRAVLASMHPKLAAADSAEGKAEMEKELLRELEALAEAGVGAAALPDGPRGVVDLCTAMTNYYQEKRKRDEHQAATIKEQCELEEAAALETAPGYDMAEENVAQQFEELEAERLNNSRTLQAHNEETSKRIAAARLRVRKADEQNAALERQLEIERDAEKNHYKKTFAELKDYIEKAPGLLKTIDETKLAIDNAQRREMECACAEENLKREFEEQKELFDKQLKEVQTRRARVEQELQALESQQQR